MKKIYVAGHTGMVGSAIVRKLERIGKFEIVTRTRQQLDLLNQSDVHHFLRSERPDYLFIAAAKVGGIHANNSLRCDFIYENLTIQNNLIYGAFKAGLEQLCFLGSSCIYPRDCPQPIKESYLLDGPLEKSNEPYAVAKIAGLKLCEALNAQHGTKYLTLMPTNLYGPNDNYDLLNSHFLPALIKKAHSAKENGENSLEVWGTGTPRRELLYVDDLADACVYFMEKVETEYMLNIGTGEDHTIREIAERVMSMVGLEGEIVFDTKKPDGTPRKLLDVSLANKNGWRHKTNIEDGFVETYADFVSKKL